MSASIRFLALAVIGWGAMRAWGTGYLPAADMFAVQSSEAAVPPIVPTTLPPLDPVEPAFLATAYPAQMTAGPQQIVYYVPASFSRPGAPRPTAELTPISHVPPPLFHAPVPQLDDWPLSRIASAALPPLRSSPAGTQADAGAMVSRPRMDRLQLTAWALVRQQPSLASLANGGTLGGSQAGARLTYHFTRELAASLRTSSPIGSSRGMEVAGSIRVQPFRAVPVALTAERRHAVGLGAGRSAFALFVEGGLYQRPMPWRFQLDAYAQGGMVGVRRRELFTDGALTLTRPVFGRFSAGFGLWGGAQPGLYRVDAGPRVTMKVRENVRVHVDWRQRVAGIATPLAGPALTLAGDF